jgi:2-keto-4-pentenoate hydratase
MASETELIRLLADAERARVHTVDPTLFAHLDIAAAYRVQAGVVDAVVERVGMLKTGIFDGTIGVVAPIFASHIGNASDFQLPVANVLGLEVEVGLVLSRDVVAAADVPSAIDHYFLGVEICGSRFTDRKLAGLNGPLADRMTALGYAIGPRRALGDRIEGLTVELDIAGSRIHSGPAKHGFGTVLASLLAYADNEHPAYPLRAGTIITTGSMCGLVPTSGAGHVVARLGDEQVEFDIV